MADFTLWCVAAEESLGWPAGTFLRHHRANRAGLVEATLDADPVATAIRRLLDLPNGGSWMGTAGDLLDTLTALHQGAPPAGGPGARWPFQTTFVARRHTFDGPLKDKESRVVPILDPLLPVLKAWKLKTGGKGFVMPPMRRDGGAIDNQTPSKHVQSVLKDLGLQREGLG